MARALGADLVGMSTSCRGHPGAALPVSASPASRSSPIWARGCMAARRSGETRDVAMAATTHPAAARSAPSCRSFDAMSDIRGRRTSLALLDLTDLSDQASEARHLAACARAVATPGAGRGDLYLAALRRRGAGQALRRSVGADRDRGQFPGRRQQTARWSQAISAEAALRRRRRDRSRAALAGLSRRATARSPARWSPPPRTTAATSCCKVILETGEYPDLGKVKAASSSPSRPGPISSRPQPARPRIRPARRRSRPCSA